MEIAVISDLHLGPGDRSDLFGHEEARFMRFLSFLEDNFEKVVLLGDIWETLTPRAPLSPKDALRAAREAHPFIASRFDRPKYTYVYGNHDIVAGSSERRPEELLLTDCGTRVLFTHGHQHDRLIRYARWASELGVWLGGWILRFGMEWVYRFFDRLDRLRAGAAAEAKECTFQRWAVNMAEQRGVDVIVTGHTHIPISAPHGNTLFMNSGSCAQGRFSFLSLDTKAARYAVHSSF